VLYRILILLGSCLLLAAGVVVTGCAAANPTCAPGDSAPTCTRVLFLGNSYTYVNDLPGTLARLAESGGHRLETQMVAKGGETLSDHVASSESMEMLASRQWDYVILQEQSTQPAYDAARTALMYPAARTLAARIRSSGGSPLLFLTWAHRDGDPQGGIATYQSMQNKVTNAYQMLAAQLDAPVAPVGFAWFVTRSEHPEIELWQDDGSHPSAAGTYLAACVFYAVIFDQSPLNLSYHSSLASDQALALQQEVERNVLALREQWNF
jgi:hypothetical protein